MDAIPSFNVQKTRSQATHIAYLLPLWGKKFIEKFFHLSLPSLLAPGNIPALSQDYESSFLFLTQKSDIPLIQAQALYHQLACACRVEFVEISDLMFEGPAGIHNITITLAYERGMRSRYEKMRQTYFFFLVADYIVADQSFNNLKSYFNAGYSGITHGAFRVAEERFSQILPCTPGHIFSSPARELLKLAFLYPHPLTIAEMVTQSHIHAMQANHLFWRVDKDMIIGRFYTRHMLCIQPELEDYGVGGPCDYCFISEMCPSGRVAHIQDSDEVCIIEAASSNHDKHQIKPGPLVMVQLAHELSRLLTQDQRINAHIPVVYHCADLHGQQLDAIQASAEFIHGVEALFSSAPQPLRGHHYWVAPINLILRNILHDPDKSRYYSSTFGTFAGIIGSATFASIWGYKLDDYPLLTIEFPKLPARKKIKKKLGELFMGLPSPKYLWQHNWLNKHLLKENLQANLLPNQTSIVIAFEPIQPLIRCLEEWYPGQITYLYYDFFKIRSQMQLKRLFDKAQHAVIYLTSDHFNELEAAVSNCAKYLSKGNSLSVFIKHKQKPISRQLQQRIDRLTADLSNLGIKFEIVELKKYFFQILSHRALKRCVSQLFDPNKSLFSRSIGVMGLLIICFESLCANSIELSKLLLRRKKSYEL